MTVDDFNVHLNINTYAETSKRSLAEVELQLDLTKTKRLEIPFYIDPLFSLEFSVSKLHDAIRNIKTMYKMADVKFVEDSVSDDICLEGLLGVDVLQYLDSFFLMKCLNGSAFSIDGALIPFGDVNKFLSPKQISDNYVNACSDYESCQTVNSTLVNCAFASESQFSDPVSSVITDSLVDANLEKMFSTESMGIIDENPSDLDQIELDKFRDNISFKNGKYHVKLPWYQEKISEVPSNFGIAKSVLSKNISDLIKRGMFDAYDKVLCEQLDEGILEEVELQNINVYNHIWIPHRAVVKTDAQSTTKVRPVLNCSLKIGKTPSLNEASYPGVNLLTNLLSLLINVRTNDILVVADIRKAFLQIMLSDESDKNRFSILWQYPNGEMRAFR